MIQYDELKKKIMEEKSLTEKQVDNLVSEEINARDGYLSKLGALILIASKQKVMAYTSASELKYIKDITKEDSNVKIVGTIVNVFAPREFERDGKTRHVVNINLDDGTDNIRCALWEEQIQQLYKLNEEEINNSGEGDWERYNNKLLGEIIALQGKVKYSEMYDRVEINARQVITDREEVDKIYDELKEQPVTEEKEKEEEESAEEIDMSGAVKE